MLFQGHGYNTSAPWTYERIVLNQPETHSGQFMQNIAQSTLSSKICGVNKSVRIRCAFGYHTDPGNEETNV